MIKKLLIKDLAHGFSSLVKKVNVKYEYFKI